MKGCSAALAALVLVALLAPGTAARTFTPEPAAAAALAFPQGTGASLAWHPLFNVSSYDEVYVDAERGRILTLSTSEPSFYSLEVRNLSGSLQATVLSVMPYNND